MVGDTIQIPNSQNQIGDHFMSAVKDEAIKLIGSLPDDCTMEDIHYHLYVREKVERGLQDVEAGRTISQEEMEQRVGQWRKSAGQDRR
jgi:hypothetical protein